MWGGARLNFHAPAKVGQSVHLHSEVRKLLVDHHSNMC